MYNEMQFEDLNPKPKIFQAELTKAQYKFLAKMMPSDYVLEVIAKPKKEVQPQPKKNTMITKTATTKTLRSKTDEASAIPTNPLDFSLPMDPSAAFGSSIQSSQSAQSSQMAGMNPLSDMFSSIYPFHSNMGTQQPNNFQLQEAMAQSPKKGKAKTDAAQPKPKKKTGESKQQQQPSTTANAKPFKAPTEIMAKCAAVLQSLKRNSLAEPFLYPIDPKSMGVPSFYTLVKEPMDLSTVEKKLKNNDYLNSNQFIVDVQKIWRNALTSNAQGSDTYRRALEMNRLFEESVKEIEAIASQKPAQEAPKAEKKAAKPQQQPQTQAQPQAQAQLPRQINGPSSSNLGNITIVDSEPTAYRSTTELPSMSLAEKQALHQKILTKIPAHSLKGVWDIVNEGVSATNPNKEMLEFDLDTLPVEVTRKLERYVDHVLKLRSIQNKTKEPTPQPKPQVQGNMQNFQFPYNNMMMQPQKAMKLDTAEKKISGFPNDPTAMFPFFPEPDLKTQTTGFGGGYNGGFNGFWGFPE